MVEHPQCAVCRTGSSIHIEEVSLDVDIGGETCGDDGGVQLLALRAAAGGEEEGVGEAIGLGGGGGSHLFVEEEGRGGSEHLVEDGGGGVLDAAESEGGVGEVGGGDAGGEEVCEEKAFVGEGVGKELGVELEEVVGSSAM